MQLGFDLSKAIDSLRRAAVAEGALLPGDPAGKDPALVALSHVHGIEHERRCHENPCRLGALCLALHELLQFEAERPRGDALGELDSAVASLDAASERVAQAARIIDRVGRPACGEAQRDQLMALTSDIAELCNRVEDLAAGLIVTIESPQLLQQPDRKPSELLLRAVWQHLHDGGFTHDEAFELVPTLGIHTKAKDVVRKRIREPDARSLLQRELHPKLYEPPRVERRRRRRPPPDSVG